MTPNAQRNLTFPWPIGDRALAANLGRTLIPVLFGPFSRHQFCNRASRERPREGARFGLSGEAVGVGSSARTMPYVFTILRSALGDAVRQRRLSANPDRPGPRPRTCQRPAAGDAGMDRAELGRFLRLGHAQDPHLAMGGRLLAATGTAARALLEG
jgi:hypothetical protein